MGTKTEHEFCGSKYVQFHAKDGSNQQEQEDESSSEVVSEMRNPWFASHVSGLSGRARKGLFRKQIIILQSGLYSEHVWLMTKVSGSWNYRCFIKGRGKRDSNTPPPLHPKFPGILKWCWKQVAAGSNPARS